jgi:translation elongation factor EF-4
MRRWTITSPVSGIAARQDGHLVNGEPVDALSNIVHRRRLRARQGARVEMRELIRVRCSDRDQASIGTHHRAKA